MVDKYFGIMMRKKKTFPIETVYIDKLVHGGQGLGVLSDGRKCFVWGALPEEQVEVQLTRSKKDWAEGFVHSVVSASTSRIEPLEPDIYMATSPWQIIEYNQEAKVKQGILAETFLREGVTVAWHAFYQQPNPYNYRNKMEYNFWYDTDNRQVSLALHKRGSHQKVAVNGSALASGAINKAAEALVLYINNKNIEARPLKSVILRSDGRGEVGISLFVNDRSVVKELMDFKYPNMVYEIVYSNPKSPASVATEVLVSPKEQLTDALLGKEFIYSTRSFFQVNVPVYEQVLGLIKKYIAEANATSVVDLYSGVGSIGLSVVDDSVQLTLIEISEESVQQAKQNIGRRENIQLIQEAAESTLEHITKDDVLIVDPPRAGLHRAVVAKIIEQQPNDVIYLSCNPSTQARDIKMLQEGGYKIIHAQGFNFFPRTPHIESLVILKK